MTIRSATLLLATLLSLTACGKQDASAPADGAPPPQAAAPAAAAPTPDASPGWAGTVPAAGSDYLVIPDGKPFAPLDGKVEVVEVFGYTCGHCANFEPIVMQWKQQQPADVRFTQVPASFGGYWSTYAKAYYTAQAMDVLEKSHESVFGALHRQRSLDPMATPAQVGAFYAQFGVDPKAFAERMESPEIAAKLDYARQFAERSKVDGTPSMVINGKYIVAPDNRGYGLMLRTVDYLAAQERAARK